MYYVFTHTHIHYCVRKVIDAFNQQGCIKLIKKSDSTYICELLDFLLTDFQGEKCERVIYNFNNFVLIKMK